MLWDPGSIKKDEQEEHDSVPITPILFPMQNKPSTMEQSVPVVVPDVQDLKDQFQQQQNMLTQIKKTLIQNESQLNSKGKQMEAYANKLSQIRARSKNNQEKKPNPLVSSSSPRLQKKSSKENLTKVDCSEGEKSTRSNSKNRKGKVSELKKCLEENKIKFEERTGKEQSETKKIESLVEQLKMQLEERDKTIHDLQKNIEAPTAKSESAQKQKPKQKESVVSKTTQTARTDRPTDQSIEIIALQNKIHELEASILDLEENLKEKESVIEARTQAVTLLSQDLSLKGKNTLESLEETRQEMRVMQNNFIAVEDQLKNELLDKNNRLATFEEKYKKLESTNFELSLRNAEQQEKLVNLQAKYLEIDAERNLLKESMVQDQMDGKIEELMKKINILTKELDDRNKAMITMKIEHKNKVKNMNKTLETLKGASEEKAEIVRLTSLLEEMESIKTGLEIRVAELEDEKGNLLLSVLDVEDFKASEKKLKDQINELEIIIQKQNEDLSTHFKRIAILEKENFDLKQSNQDLNSLIEDLQARISDMESGKKVENDKENELKELNERIASMEEEYNRRVEELKREHRKEIEMQESCYNVKGESLDRKALEEYRISTEINNIHVEEQIELLIREKQQLLEKLKSLSEVSSTNSLTFEKMKHSDIRDDRETVLPLDEETDFHGQENRLVHMEKIVSDQQQVINDLQKTIAEEKEKMQTYRQRISDLENTIKSLEEANASFKQQIEMSEAAESGKSTKTNTNTKNRIKKIEMELMQNKKTVQVQNEKFVELKLKLQEKEDLIKKYTERIELFEKDDWDRQNYWKNTEDEIESAQELQKKCLSLENSLFELTEDCERLRKENIEVVHLLSEEKVKRRKLLEELETKSGTKTWEIDERIKTMNQVLADLIEKVEKLEISHANEALEVYADSGVEKLEQWEVTDLHKKLEWTNIVLTSKETEIFTLQNLLEDRNKAIEFLELDSKELKRKLEESDKKLEEITNELKAKEAQLEEISANFGRLQETVDAANHKTAANEQQLKELLSTVKEMEGDVLKKESELQEIKGILSEKNLDMTNLRNRLEEVNSDLTYSYQEHLENMGKCLRDKESDYDALLSEKNVLEELNKQLAKEKEDINNRKVEILKEKECIELASLEKDKIITELRDKLKLMEKPHEEGKNKSQEKEDLKIKLKKLAANLKKKAQSEADLMKKMQELEIIVSEKEKRLEGLEIEVKEVTEKWTVEKTEKEKIADELSVSLAEKAALEATEIGVRHRVASLEKELQESGVHHEIEIMELQRQIQQLKETCNRMQIVEQEDKKNILRLEAKAAEFYQLYQDVVSLEKETQEKVDSETQALKQSLIEMTENYEKIKSKHDQLLLEKSELEKRFVELERMCEEFNSQKLGLEAKTQENFAVIESLEGQLKKTRDQMKTVEEKFFNSEERRLSLESKNQEMCKKIMENCENLTTIDDLSIRVEELVKSEKFLQSSVTNLQSENAELKQTLNRIITEREDLEKELKTCGDKCAETATELKVLKSFDEEKNNLISELTEAVERLKIEKKQLSSNYEKLNRDYEQFEVDFKENLENSQNIEKSLRHKIEELVSENASLTEKCKFLSEDVHHSETKPKEEGGEKKPKKRKSVTFRTDEVEYIKDLKRQLHSYCANLKLANEEMENLRAELFRERLRNEVSNVVAEAQKKVESLSSTPEAKEAAAEVIFNKCEQGMESPKEKKFDGSAFFGHAAEEPFLKVKSEEPQLSSEFDSLMWDDGWGVEGNLEAEYLSGKAIESEKLESDYRVKMKALETKLETSEAENKRLRVELQEQTTKYTKVLKKLKEVKTAHDRLHSEASKLKIGFGDLDEAIFDELKFQIENLEKKEKELIKSLENSKQEKETLLKRIDHLSAGNDKFLEIKENQDKEIEIWQRKNNELLEEIASLRSEQPKECRVSDDNSLVTENQELRNKVEALEWKNCELTEIIEEKQELLENSAQIIDNKMEKVMKEKSQLQKEVEELDNMRECLMKKLLDEEEKNKMTVGELNEQLTALASENETLKDILDQMEKSKKDKAQESKIIDYFRSSPGIELFTAAASTPNTEHFPTTQLQVKQLEKEMETLRQKISDLEGLLRDKEEEMKKVWKEADIAIKLKDDQLHHLQLEKESESQRFSVKENEGVALELTESSLEPEKLLGLKESSERELKASKRVQQPQSSLSPKDQFETIDLSQEANTVLENEAEDLRGKILNLETLLSQREEEFQLFSQTKGDEEEGLRQRIFQLEDAVRLREEELKRLESDMGIEMDALRLKAAELEELARFQVNELYQVQTAKANEVQCLNQRVFELENTLREGVTQQRPFEFENLLKEEEFHQKCLEIETLKQRVADLENAIAAKDGEVAYLKTRVNELEKSYNDSKLEIERLLNEEKLNVEEKFVEPFQKNMKIPVAFEVEALSRTLNEEKQKSENLLYELSEKESLVAAANVQVQNLNSKLLEMENKMKGLRQVESDYRELQEQSAQVRAQLEKIISDLQQELESSNLQLSVAQRELQELQKMKDEAISNLKSQLFDLETELVESRERQQGEVAALRSELTEKTKQYETSIIEERKAGEKNKETMRELETIKSDLEKEVERLKGELESKERELEDLVQTLHKEGYKVAQTKEMLQIREREAADLKETLMHLQEEMKHFRNFENQVKDLRVTQIKEASSEVFVTPESQSELSDWTEHELAELSTRLQSDLDTALYMLHQRDVRCDELTFELKQLLEERDTLQLRLSTALRINEELKTVAKPEEISSGHSLQESKDLVDQSNDRQQERSGENLRQLADKISELHSVSYLRDKTVKDESVQRHKEQMNLLNRISDSDMTLSRDFQSSPASLLNWMRGKTTPKVMHI